jgi:hypothetical protein
MRSDCDVNSPQRLALQHSTNMYLNPLHRAERRPPLAIYKGVCCKNIHTATWKMSRSMPGVHMSAATNPNSAQWTFGDKRKKCRMLSYMRLETFGGPFYIKGTLLHRLFVDSSSLCMALLPFYEFRRYDTRLSHNCSTTVPRKGWSLQNCLCPYAQSRPRSSAHPTTGRCT